MSEWIPIESAPHNGSEIIVFMDMAGTPVVHVARWEDDPPDWKAGWWSYTMSSVSQELLEEWGKVTHWIPLPKDPKE